MKLIRRALSRLDNDNRLTIPRAVRDALGLKSGDMVSFELNESGRVILEKGESSKLGYLDAPASTLEEWLSAEDEAAYRAL